MKRFACVLTILCAIGVVSGQEVFETYVYTLSDIILFSYEDSTELEVLNMDDITLWSDTLQEGDYHHVMSGPGVFQIISNKEFAVLIGDPISDQVLGYYAVDNHNRCVAERFFTLQTTNWGGAEFIVFAYEDSTVGEIRDSPGGGVMHTFALDSAEHISIPATSTPVEVVANKGVSALSYGDQGYWVPAANGTFAGKLFFTWRGYLQSWPNDINVMAFYENTHVTITNTETGELLKEADLSENGICTLVGGEPIYVTIESNKPVTCLVAPFVSYAGGYARLYCGMDISGQGIGTKFLHPTISGGRLDILSFYDDNDVRVYDQRIGSLVWQGTLQSGGHRMLSPQNTLYRIESDTGIAIFDEMGDRAGAIFAPLWFAIHPDVWVGPDPQYRQTSPGVPVSEFPPGGCYEVDVENNGNIWDIVNLSTSHSCPEHFTSQMYDELGGSLPDADGDGNPDTDTLTKGSSVLVLVDVFPSDSVPIGTIDTCYMVGVSHRNEDKCDTALLVTRIVPSSVTEEPGMPGMKVSLDMITNTLYLSFSGLGEAEVSFKLFDATGRKILSQVIHEPQATINVSHLPRGVYFVSARIGESERLVRKVIIY